MSRPQPDWDIDLKDGKLGESWLVEIMGEASGNIEVKSPKPFLRFHNEFGPYVEYKCFKGGVWEPSGIQTTKAKLWFFKFGALPGGLLVETAWLKRAALLAFESPRLRKQETDGDYPTKGVIVTMRCLWDRRVGEP